MVQDEQILCIRIGGLGDLLAALPSLRLIRLARPGARLVLLGRRDYGGLLLRAKVVDEVADAGGAEFAGLLAGSGRGVVSRGSLLDRFSLVVGWMNSQERGREIEAALKAAGKECAIIGLSAAGGQAISRFFFARTAAALAPSPVLSTVDGAGTFEDCARLWVPAAGPESRERFVIIHPGSGAAEKCWPLDRFLELARRLGGRGFAGGIVLGEAEGRLAGELGLRGLPPDWRGVDRPPLSVLSYLLGRTCLYIGNDSGVTHLAAACGAPVLALFLEKNLPAWAPFGRSRTIAAPEMAAIGVLRVWEEAATILGLGGP
ncbi:MAG: glycosyltransferase family 9 protein [Candidatus Aminicenantes bacterium]|nr:glycosyltransferase family 9 protein [Candidatus Aminicenantes bacterium]